MTVNGLRKSALFLFFFTFFSVAVFLIVDLFVFPFMQGKFYSTVVVPELVGRDSLSAKDLISEAGLSLGEIVLSYSDSLASGTVMNQFPTAGQEVKAERSVSLVISAGLDFRIVPQILGLMPLVAVDTLLKRGLRLGEVKESFSPDVEQGTIIAVSHQPGTKLVKGGAVDVVIASRAVGNVASVPFTVGLTIEEGKRLILKSGLRLGSVTLKVDSEMLPGTILKQSVAAGALVSRGSLIDLTVSE